MSDKYVTLETAVKTVKAIAMRKAESGSKAQRAGRWDVADARFEEARVLTEEVVPALEGLAF